MVIKSLLKLAIPMVVIGMLASCLILSSCTGNNLEKQILGKWRLTRLSVSEDGGKNFEMMEHAENEEIIFFEDGHALYTDQVLYTRLDSAEWRVYSDGDSLEILDEKHKHTGVYNKYRIAKIFREQTSNGEDALIMELQMTVTHNDPSIGEQSIVAMYRYEQVTPYRITVKDTEAPLLSGKPIIHTKFAFSHNRVGFYKTSDMKREHASVERLNLWPIIEENSEAYCIDFNGSVRGTKEWVYRNEVTEVGTTDITTDIFPNLFINKGVNCTQIHYSKDNLKGLAFIFYFDKGKGIIKVCLLQDGVMILPQKFEIEAIEKQENGLKVEPCWTKDSSPRVYYGPDYRLKEGNLEGYLDLSILNKEDAMAIWQAAQNNTPDKVHVVYLASNQNGFAIIEENVE